MGSSEVLAVRKQPPNTQQVNASRETTKYLIVLLALFDSQDHNQD